MRLQSIATCAVVAGLLLAPGGTVSSPARGSGLSVVAGASVSASSPAMTPLASRKPSAGLSVDSRMLPSGQVRLTVRSLAKSVKVSYRTPTGKARIVTRRTKRGAVRITLPEGSHSIRVRARSTSRMSASPWLSVTPVPTPAPVPVASPTGSEPATSPPTGSEPATSPPPATPPPTPPAPTPPPPTGANAVEVEVVGLVNQARSGARTCGTTAYPAVPALAMNDLLVRSAREHSQDMATNGYFSHTGLDGSEPWDRMTSVGYTWSAAGENIAAGQTTAQQVVTAWLTSPGHCSNIMSGSFTEIGVGHAYSATARYGHYWTQNFGRR